MCELLCSVPADADAYQYWSERAEQLDNGHPVVFKLREHMLNMAPEKSDDNIVRKELEDLILGMFSIIIFYFNKLCSTYYKLQVY